MKLFCPQLMAKKQEINLKFPFPWDKFSKFVFLRKKQHKKGTCSLFPGSKSFSMPVTFHNICWKSCAKGMNLSINDIVITSNGTKYSIMVPYHQISTNSMSLQNKMYRFTKMSLAMHTEKKK